MRDSASMSRYQLVAQLDRVLAAGRGHNRRRLRDRKARHYSYLAACRLWGRRVGQAVAAAGALLEIHRPGRDARNDRCDGSLADAHSYGSPDRSLPGGVKLFGLAPLEERGVIGSRDGYRHPPRDRRRLANRVGQGHRRSHADGARRRPRRGSRAGRARRGTRAVARVGCSRQPGSLAHGDREAPGHRSSAAWEAR